MNHAITDDIIAHAERIQALGGSPRRYLREQLFGREIRTGVTTTPRHKRTAPRRAAAKRASTARKANR